MNFRTTRAKLGAAAVAVLATGTLAIGASPASASASSGYISGGGTFTDDFGDEGELSSSSYRYSDATCLWQKILWAEGELSYSGIDGDFGSGTTAATKSLQSRWGLTADGKVGNNTFGKADGNLEYVSGNSTDGYKLTYDGTSYDFTLYRTVGGTYRFAQDSFTRSASYNDRGCS